MTNTMRRLVETALLPETFEYRGTELRSHFIREQSRIQSDGVVAFLGGCLVDGERLVDLEDADAGSEIVSKRMIHFIGEHFQCALREANFRLRLFISIAGDVIREMAPAARVVRRGDDLFVGDRKLSVAICTVTPTSTVFHFGVNDDPLGAPVPAIGLAELGVDARAFALAVLERYSGECESIELAIAKVKAVP